MPRTTKKSVSLPKPVSNTVSNTISKPSLLTSIKEGFGFGLGSTIARNMFSSSPIQTLPSSNISCIEYNKCLESNDKYECFGNLDQKEYVNCKTIN